MKLLKGVVYEGSTCSEGCIIKRFSLVVKDSEGEGYSPEDVFMALFPDLKLDLSSGDGVMEMFSLYADNSAGESEVYFLKVESIEDYNPLNPPEDLILDKQYYRKTGLTIKTVKVRLGPAAKFSVYDLETIPCVAKVRAVFRRQVQSETFDKLYSDYFGGLPKTYGIDGDFEYQYRRIEHEGEVHHCAIEIK